MMSSAAAHESTLAPGACRICHDLNAMFRVLRATGRSGKPDLGKPGPGRQGDVRADRDHVLCFECCRAERNRRHARPLAGVDTPAFLRPSAAAPILTAGAIAHRQRMLTHLRASTAGAASRQP
jgi:hypothetical protein